jgi:hypothetical protein
MNNAYNLKYESRDQFISWFWSLIDEKNGKYQWLGDVENNVPIFKFNNIIINVNDFVNIWRRRNNTDIVLINKGIKYNRKNDIYLNIIKPIELDINDHIEIKKLYYIKKNTLPSNTDIKYSVLNIW